MSFINKKEEVINIELTQFGKRLLSKGNFKPTFYQFFDDDIMYDGQYAGIAEKQNDIQTRIGDSPRLGLQYSATNLEEKFSQETKDIESGLEDLFKEIKHSVNTTEREKLLSYPMGNITLGSQIPPMFNLGALEAKITNNGVLENLTQSGIPAQIPQINFEPVHELVKDTRHATDQDQGQLYDEETYILDFTENNLEFLDNSILQYNPENVTIVLEETSVPFTKENFEIEIFEVQQESDGQEIFIEITDMEEVLKLFEIKTDSSVELASQQHYRGRNFFSN